LWNRKLEFDHDPQAKIVTAQRVFHGVRDSWHDASLRDIYHKLLPLLQPPADPPKRRIGFISGD
jgi:hypothetical protein